MISHKFRCIFVHIPKTGGQSVEQFFLDKHGLTWEQRAELLLLPNTDPAKGPESLAHLTAREYVELGYVTPEQFKTYFKFTFTRNPWERLFSEYLYRYQDRYRAFKDFVMQFALPTLEHADTHLDAYRHLMPQRAFLKGETGWSLMDYAGRFEDFQAYFDGVCKRLGILPIRLPVRNPSKLRRKWMDWRITREIRTRDRRIAANKAKRAAAAYPDHYDNELREIVGTVYADDIKPLCYEFGE